jgi:hypothetical protein
LTSLKNINIIKVHVYSVPYNHFGELGQMKSKKTRKTICLECNYAIILDGKTAFCNILMRNASHKSCTAFERNWQINDISPEKPKERKKEI